MHSEIEKNIELKSKGIYLYKYIYIKFRKN